MALPLQSPPSPRTQLQTVKTQLQTVQEKYEVLDCQYQKALRRIRDLEGTMKKINDLAEGAFNPYSGSLHAYQ